MADDNEIKDPKLEVVGGSKLPDVEASGGSTKGDKMDLEAITVAEPSEEAEDAPLTGWRQESPTISLEGSNSTMKVPPVDAPWYKQYLAFVGVGFMVSVGYCPVLHSRTHER